MHNRVRLENKLLEIKKLEEKLTKLKEELNSLELPDIFKKLADS